jgi:quinol monooxygenase YgiN
MTEPRAGFAAFQTVHTEDPDDVITALRRHAHTSLATTPGLVSARVHVSVDGTTVVRRTEWRDEAAYRQSTGSADLAGLPGIRKVTEFEGTPAEGLTGPAAGQEPRIVVVATRRLAGPEAVDAVLATLARSGRWKRDFPGFISATPYVSADSRTFVNYPMWVDEGAFRAWTADPNINSAREEVTDHEVEPPDILVCRVVETITPEGDRP